MIVKEKNKKSYIGGLITGGIIGVITGILMAPKSGKEIRKDISDKTDEILNDTDKLLNNAKEKATEIISETTKKAEKIIKETGNKVESLMNCTDELLILSKDKVKDSLSRVKGSVNYNSVFRNKNIY